MAHIELMGWSRKQRRWFKRYRGKLYFVSPKQLGTESTKEASRQAANEWWDKKQKEIDDALGKAKQLPTEVVEHYHEAKENHRLYAKWHRKHGSLEEAKYAESVIEWLDVQLKSDAPSFPLNKTQFDPRWKLRRELNADDDEMAFDLLWMDRFNAILKEERNETCTPPDNMIRSHIDDYLGLRRAQFQARNKIHTFYSMKQWLGVFRDFVDPFAPIEQLNEQLWEKFFIHLSARVAKGDYSPTTAKNYQGAARSFIKNRYEGRFIENLRNLTSRQLTFSIPSKDPVVFTKEEIKVHLESANPRQKLYILLMLNCGMYGSDISHLRQDEVDWKEGRINRKRTKTRDKSDKVPKVDYPLWRETFALLKQERSGHDELVLLNQDGKPLVEEYDNDGKWGRKNNIKSAIFRLQRDVLELKDAKNRKPLKSFRKTGATFLEQSAYGRFTEHYLGEAPSTMASRHYAHKNGPEFDEAIKWLGQQFGLK